MAEIFFYSNNNREIISEHTASKRPALESELSKIEQWITQVEKNVATLDTLLYWLKICRDEQMAMARNI